jgi:hypothetical protein
MGLRVMPESAEPKRAEVEPSEVIPYRHKPDDSSGWWAGPIFCFLLVGYFALVFYAPHQKRLTAEEQASLNKARLAVATVLQQRLVQASNLEKTSRTNLPVSDAELGRALDAIRGPQKDAGTKSEPDETVIDLTTQKKTEKACPFFGPPYKEGKYQYVDLSDGTVRRFPASASKAQINSAMAKEFPGCATKVGNLPRYDINGNRIDDTSPSNQIIDLDTEKKTSDPLAVLTPKQEKPAASAMSESAVLRIEPRGGNNLYIYLRKSDFEIVLYPDRKEFASAVGKAWCDNTGEDSHWLLPSVYIGDIRTGEELASYSCVFDSVSW